MPSTRKLCVNCKSCEWVRMDADGPQWPTCSSPKTKEFNHPIFGLHLDSRACKLFEMRPGGRSQLTVATAHRKLMELAAQKSKVAAHSWQVLWKTAELLAVGVAGAGASNLSQTRGVIAFGCGLGVAVLSMVIRITSSR